MTIDVTAERVIPLPPERVAPYAMVVDGAAVAEDDMLGAWLDEGRAFAASLPPK